MSPRLLRPRAAGNFDPRTITGLEAWWDAADSASVTLDSGRVATWNDKSGKGRHATNSTSGSTQPDYITAARNGRNGLRFTAASTQRLSVPSSTAAFNFLHNGTLSYVAFVASFGATSNPNAAYTLFGNAQGSTSSRGTILIWDNRSATSAVDRLGANVGNGTAGVSTTLTASYDNLAPEQQPVVGEMLLDVGNATQGDRIAIRANGGNLVKAATGTGTPSTSDAAANMFIGTLSNLALPMTGDIYEIIIYSQHPTEAAQATIRRYLAGKWGVTLA